MFVDCSREGETASDAGESVGELCSVHQVPTDSQNRRDRNRAFPFPFLSRAAFELASKRLGSMDQAGAPFPAPATFLELSTFGVLSVAAFTPLSVAAIQLQRHANSSWKLEEI